MVSDVGGHQYCVPVSYRTIPCPFTSPTEEMKYGIVLRHLIVVRNNLNPQIYRNVSIVTEKKTKTVSTSMQCHPLVESLLLLKSLKTWRGCTSIDETKFYMFLRKEHQNAIIFNTRPSRFSIAVAHLQTSTNLGMSMALDILIILIFARNVYMYYTELYTQPQPDGSNEDVPDISVNNINNEREIFDNFLNHIRGSPSSRMDVDQSCSICLESLNSGSLFQPRTCSHIFHRMCLSQWLQSGGRNCPICRRDFVSQY